MVVIFIKNKVKELQLLFMFLLDPVKESDTDIMAIVMIRVIVVILILLSMLMITMLREMMLLLLMMMMTWLLCTDGSQNILLLRTSCWI